MQLPPKVTDRAFARLAEIGAAQQGQALRVAVEGGGCSGFQYQIDLDAPAADDLVLEGQGEKVVVDAVSLPFLSDELRPGDLFVTMGAGDNWKLGRALYDARAAAEARSKGQS